MCIAVVGGMTRLKAHYHQEAGKFGIDLKLFNTLSPGMGAKLKNVDAVVLFTNKVSHTARREVVQAVRRHDIPLYQFHSCGLCTLRDCLNCLKNGETPRSSSLPCHKGQ